MTPNINLSNPPRFHELGEFVFQELCHDLFEVQDGIVACEIYGRRGQAQRGIDLLASCDDAKSTEVGQCKAHEDFSAQKIIEASDKFFEHWEFWKDKNVRRFILFVACPLDDPQAQNEIQVQRARFQAVGIRYEAWSARTLVTRLRPHRAIAERHIRSEEIVNDICGSPLDSQIKATTPPGIDLTLSLLSSQVEEFAAGFSEVVGEKFERARELSREGKTDGAHSKILAMKSDKSWDLLEKPLRARILRLNASLVLKTEKNTGEAKNLRDEAAALDPTADDAALRGIIKYYEAGNEAGLQEVNDPKDVIALNLKLGFLVELGRSDEALALIQQLPSGVEPDADTERLHALLLLLKGELSEAEQRVGRAFEQRPSWQGVRHAYAIINYFSALSPAALPTGMISWPTPIPWPLVKRDPESQERLRKAELQFAGLAADAEQIREQRSAFNLWRLACLANDVDRQDEAAEFCRAQLADNPADSHTLAWALSRHYDVDMHAMEKSLERALGVDANDDSY